MPDDILIDNFTVDDLPNNILKGIYQYWHDIKGDRLMPSRADLNPADIAQFLPYISLIDVEQNPRRYKVRLVGTETVNAMNIDTTGRYMDEFPLVECHLKDRFDWMVRQKRPYLISGKLRWSRKSFLNFCSIGIPLSNNDEDSVILMYGSHYYAPKTSTKKGLQH